MDPLSYSQVEDFANSFIGIFDNATFDSKIKIINNLTPQFPLWEIEKDGQKFGYLTGAIHVHPEIRKEDIDKVGHLWDALAECGNLALESDITNPQNCKEAEACYQAEINKEEYLIFKKDHNIDEKEKLCSFFPSHTDMCTMTDTWETRLASVVKQKSTGSVISLEKLSLHMHSVVKLQQLSLSRLSFSSICLPSVTEDRLNLLAAWAKGDLKKANKISPDFVNDFHTILRNKEMAEKIDSFFQEKIKLLILVGVLHVKGKEGLISQLRRKGYSVTKVRQLEEVL